MALRERRGKPNSVPVCLGIAKTYCSDVFPHFPRYSLQYPHVQVSVGLNKMPTHYRFGTMSAPKRRVRKDSQPSSAQLLREARTSAGLSQKKAAALTGVDYTHLSKIENAAAVPSVELLERLVRCYGIDNPDELYASLRVLPPDIDEIIATRSVEAYAVLRTRFADS
jgi:transcriptional regulator with XRE-family HTH domain